LSNDWHYPNLRCQNAGLDSIAESAGATAEVEIVPYAPVVYNNIQLTKKMIPTLERVAGESNVIITKAGTGAEDFAFYANEVPSLFLSLGGMKKGMSVIDAPPHHTPDFYIDESGMKLGVRTLCNMALDYMGQ